MKCLFTIFVIFLVLSVCLVICLKSSKYYIESLFNINQIESNISNINYKIRDLYEQIDMLEEPVMDEQLISIIEKIQELNYKLEENRELIDNRLRTIEEKGDPEQIKIPIKRKWRIWRR